MLFHWVMELKGGAVDFANSLIGRAETGLHIATPAGRWILGAACLSRFVGFRGAPIQIHMRPVFRVIDRHQVRPLHCVFQRFGHHQSHGLSGIVDLIILQDLNDASGWRRLLLLHRRKLGRVQVSHHQNYAGQCLSGFGIDAANAPVRHGADDQHSVQCSFNLLLIGVCRAAGYLKLSIEPVEWLSN